MTAKPIETVYKWYKFRSRAEARWAVFFDFLGIEFEYEPEGFKLSDGTFYLPDFYLPRQKTWFEVKGIMTSDDEHKVNQFIEDTNMPVAIGYSDLTFQSPMLDNNGNGFGVDTKEDSMIGKCYKCNNIYFVAEAGSYACPCCGNYDGNNTFDWMADGYDPLDSHVPVVYAFQKARQARFEHGESG